MGYSHYMSNTLKKCCVVRDQIYFIENELPLIEIHTHMQLLFNYSISLKKKKKIGVARPPNTPA